MLNPNKLAAQSTVYSIMGPSNNSVCCRKGSADMSKLLAYLLHNGKIEGEKHSEEHPRHTVISQEENDDIIAKGDKIQGVTQKEGYPRTTIRRPLDRRWNGR